MVTKVVKHEEKSWRVPEIAVRLGVTTIAVLKQIRDKKLIARKDINGHWLVDESQVAAYEARRGAREQRRPPVPAKMGAHSQRASVAGDLRRRSTDLFPEFRLVIDGSAVNNRLEAIERQMREIHELLVART